MKYILAILMMISVPDISEATVKNEQEAFRAVARVHTTTSSSEGRGTATAFAEDENSVYFLTCYHVVKEGEAKVQLLREGFEGPELPTTTVYKSYSRTKKRDIAVLQLNKSLLNGYEVPTIKLAREGLNIQPRAIYSIGSPGGGRLTMFQGHVQGYKDGIQFQPIPMTGRSGSSIIMKIDDEYQIVGVIGWKTKSYGLAMDINQIYSILRQEEISFPESNSLTEVPFSSAKEVQYCQDGFCPTPFKGIFEKTPQEVNPNNPWIKTPKNVLPTPGPPILVSGLEGRVSNLEKDLKDIEKNLATIKAGGEAQYKKLDEAIKALSTLVTTTNTTITTLDSNVKNNYAHRDSLTGLVTVADMEKHTDTELEEVVSTVDKKTDDKLTKVLSGVKGAADAIAPWVGIIPTPQTAGVGGGLAILSAGLGLVVNRRRKRKGIVVDEPKAPIETPLNPVVTPEPRVDIQETIKGAIGDQFKTVMQQLLEDNKKKDEQIALPTYPEPQEPVHVPVPRPVPQDPSPTIVYTTESNNDDSRMLREAMEVVSRAHPKTANTIRHIEDTYKQIKGGK